MRYQINPVPQKLAPRFHEVSSQRSPRDSDAVPRAHYKNADNTKQLSQVVQNIQQLQRELYRMRRRSSGGSTGSSTGWFWNSPIELPAAPYPAIGKGAVIHLQPGHALVTTGIIDAANPTGPLVKSLPGSYIAMRYVQAQITMSGNPVWNLPQFPMPTPGNWDDCSNFWRYWPDPTGCT